MKQNDPNILCLWPEADGAEAKSTRRLQTIVRPILAQEETEILSESRQIEDTLKKLTETSEMTILLFVLDLQEDGVSLGAEKLLRMLRHTAVKQDRCLAGIIVDCDNANYTKAEATRFVQAANAAGISFPGAPLVEATKDLKNFSIRARNAQTTREEAYADSVRMLLSRLRKTAEELQAQPRENPRSILALHASSHETSNTYALFEKVKQKILQEAPDTVIEEIGLRNGTLQDCSGCPYKMCLHFGENASCFYGGVMVEEVYPALRRADTVLMICPNYNDALSANLVAFINRLSALYRVEPFFDKALFSIIVSGYSGGDILERQLISALNMNKGFFLPGRFALAERAMEPGEAAALKGIDARCGAFAEGMLRLPFLRWSTDAKSGIIKAQTTKYNL